VVDPVAVTTARAAGVRAAGARVLLHEPSALSWVTLDAMVMAGMFPCRVRVSGMRRCRRRVRVRMPAVTARERDFRRQREQRGKNDCKDSLHGFPRQRASTAQPELRLESHH